MAEGKYHEVGVAKQATEGGGSFSGGLGACSSTKMSIKPGGFFILFCFKLLGGGGD